ncbi:hypothetical protein [Komagataeibacter oboediens]|uniref:hypothetical protein n=2 Tax=Komagataeibacter oboediens TaxID=65958 RepID=UPI00200CC1A7|nr:hypothetical protein [Komagataeibacter oboediens]
MTSMTAAFMLLAAPAATVPPVGKLQAGCYRVDPAHTQIIFFLLHMEFTHYSGMFSGMIFQVQAVHCSLIRRIHPLRG